MKWLAMVVAIGFVAACSDESVFGVPQYSSVRPFDVVLAPGEEILVDGVYGIAFTGVTEDSRCAVDVVCIWQGNAAVAIGLTVGKGPTHPFTLNTGVEPYRVEHAGYRVRLLSLSPQPVSTAPIEQKRYRARLHVEAVR